ncbi:MAG: hypothetical protein KDI48_00165 [Xanthomonadales bacterium]|nr:hypothetical protein [Xanthomonadales bacterium]
MRRWLLLTLLCWSSMVLAIPTPPSSDMPDGQGPWVVRAYFPDRAALNLLARRSAPWQVNHHEGWVLVEVANRFEYQRLLDADFKLLLDGERTRVLREPAALRSIPGFACYRTVEETSQTLQQLVLDHPDLARMQTIGDSWERAQQPAEGYALEVLILGNQNVPGPKPTLFIMGAVHAREYTTAELVTRFAEGLLADYQDNAGVRWLLDTHEIHLLPQSNPDGRKQAESGQLWRKNVNENYCGTTSSNRGADLNRNFPYEWGAHEGSSPEPCDSTYRGLSPASEPETDAIVDYVRSIFPDRRPDDLVTPAPADTQGMFLDLHSFSQLVIWPWGFTDTPAPNGTELTTLGRRLAWFNGYTAQQAIELYVTDGTTDDFAYGELGVPAYTFELGTEFFEDCSTFEELILPQNLAALRYALNVSSLPYQWPSGPDLLSLAAAPIEPGEQALFFAQADDRRFQQANGQEATQRIIGAQIRSDAIDGPVVAFMSALDGSFDDDHEVVVGFVDSSGRSVGRHLLLAQAEDESGAVGPPAAQWLEVVDVGTTGRVQGQVLDAVTQLPLSTGYVQSDPYATLNGGGGYALRLPAGLREVRAQAEGYVPSPAETVDVLAGQTAQLDFSLLPECSLLASDAESGEPEGWTFIFPWAPSNTHSFSPTQAFTDSPSGDYTNGANNWMQLPVMDLSDISTPLLRFASRCDTEAGFDFGRVEYRIDGGSWVEVWRCSGSPTWSEVEVDLSDLAGVSSAEIRFRLTSDGFQTADGWYVDDIELVGGTLNCPSAPDWEGFADGFEAP